MHRIRRNNDSAMWFIHELSSRVVAESGLPEDRYHLGKLILQSLKDAPDFILQIDGGTGKSETCGSVLERSVKCANAMRALGLQRGDVIILMAPNHLDLCIPYYAALYLGVSIAPIDRTLQIRELQDVFATDEPKLVFCQIERANDVRSALNKCKLLNTKIVTFDENSEKAGSIAFAEMLDKANGTVEEFKVTDFNPGDTAALLVATSGTTGSPKQSIQTHKAFAIKDFYAWSRYTKFPTPVNMIFFISPLQWLTAISNFNNAPILRITRLQTSLNIDQQHCYDLINKYKPNVFMLSPTLLHTLFTPGDRDRCDFSCFETILTGGGVVSTELLKDIKKIYPNVEVFKAYGISEINLMAFFWDGEVPASCGKPTGFLKYRLIDLDTKKDIVETHKTGELWLKTPTPFKGYYRKPEVTKEAISEDGWFRTGDLLYRDKHWNFYFLDRIKLLLKYKNHQISPVEIQDVIREHPSVIDVVVVGIPDKECGDLPVACVIPRSGFNITAQEIKDLVKDSLADSKQLRGGVIFLQQFPTLPNTKVNYIKLKEMVLQMNRE